MVGTPGLVPVAQASVTEYTLMTLAANKEETMSAKKKRHKAIKPGLVKGIEEQEPRRRCEEEATRGARKKPALLKENWPQKPTSS